MLGLQLILVYKTSHIFEPCSSQIINSHTQQSHLLFYYLSESSSLCFALINKVMRTTWIKNSTCAEKIFFFADSFLASDSILSLMHAHVCICVYMCLIVSNVRSVLQIFDWYAREGVRTGAKLIPAHCKGGFYGFSIQSGHLRAISPAFAYANYLAGPCAMKHALGGINAGLWCIRTRISLAIILAFPTYAIRNVFVLNVFEKDRFAARMAHSRTICNSDICRFGFTAAESKSRIGPGYFETTGCLFNHTDITRKTERKTIVLTAS